MSVERTVEAVFQRVIPLIREHPAAGWYLAVYAGDSARTALQAAGPAYLSGLVLEADSESGEEAPLNEGTTFDVEDLAILGGGHAAEWLTDALELLERDPASHAWIRLYKRGATSPAVSVPHRLHEEDQSESALRPGTELSYVVSVLGKQLEYSGRAIQMRDREARQDRDALLNSVLQLAELRAEVGAASADGAAFSEALAALAPLLPEAIRAYREGKARTASEIPAPVGVGAATIGPDGAAIVALRTVDGGAASVVFSVDDVIDLLTAQASGAPDAITLTRLARLWSGLPADLRAAISRMGQAG